MSYEDLGLEDYEIVDQTLIIDGDIIIYRPCCIFNEDDDHSRMMIAKLINKKIDDLMHAANCNKYIMFVTTKYNFRDQLVDDYKGNRKDVERPVNLAWAKKWATENLNTEYVKGLEADDLLGIYMAEDTVLWSLDKDLRQLAGKHLDDKTQQIKVITNEGELIGGGKKVYFTGMVGFYYQCLIGDSTDHIVGCGKRVTATYKSGAKKGQEYIKRQGIGSSAAVKLLTKAAAENPDRVLEACLEVVVEEYKKLGGSWKEHLETQANLLWMVRELDGNKIKRWTVDGRDEWFDLVKGVVIHDSEAT